MFWKMNEKNNGTVTIFTGQHDICENNERSGSVEKYMFLKIFIKRNNKDNSLIKATVKLNSMYRNSNFSIITNPQDFLNYNKEAFMAKLNKAIAKAEDQVKDKLDNAYYRKYYIADDNLREQFWLYFEECRKQTLGNNKGKIEIWNIDKIRENLKKEHLRASMNEKLSTDGIHNVDVTSHNEYEDDTHNIFINIEMRKSYWLKSSYDKFQIRIINGFYGRRDESFNIFSEKTKNWMYMDKEEFMKKVESIANNSFTDFKVKILTSPELLEVIWTMFSTLRNEYVPAVEYCDNLKNEIVTKIIGA